MDHYYYYGEEKSLEEIFYRKLWINERAHQPLLISHGAAENIVKSDGKKNSILLLL